MGLLWDLLQQSQISTNREETQDVEARVRELESDLRQTRETLHALIAYLESRFGHDIDGDGQVDGLEGYRGPSGG